MQSKSSLGRWRRRRAATRLVELDSVVNFVVEFMREDLYLQRYQDVDRAGIGALDHWIRFGRFEGRSPHPLFDPHWYSRRYPDVQPWNALDHYLTFGWREGRDPNVYFTARDAFRELSEVRKGITDPLTSVARELDAGREVIIGSLDTLSLKRLVGGNDPVETLHRYQVGGWSVPLPREVNIGCQWPLETIPTIADVVSFSRMPDRVIALPNTRSASIILLVHQLHASLSLCLEALIATPLSDGDEVILVTNGVDDAELSCALLEIGGKCGWRHINLEVNLGFTVATNIATSAASNGNDIVWLNSDAVVSGDWLNRLKEHARRPSVASVTALSNAATIGSYPVFGREMTYWPSPEPAKLNELAALANPGVAIEVPSGVGFCMLLTRPAIDAVGELNEDAFPRGYGEENDWCRRAAAAGFVNLIAMDTYVWHQGSATWSSTENQVQIDAGLEQLENLHPGYRDLIHSFITSEAAQPIRSAFALLDVVRLANEAGVSRVLIIHQLGGGTLTFIDREMGGVQPGDLLLVLEASGEGFWIAAPEETFIPSCQDLDNPIAIENLARVVTLLKPDVVQVHSLVVRHPERLVGELISLARDVDVQLFLHDFAAVCRRITLLAGRNAHGRARFCGGEPDAFVCDRCCQENGASIDAPGTREWRDLTRALSLVSSECWCPSESARDLLARLGVRADVWKHTQSFTNLPGVPSISVLTHLLRRPGLGQPTFIRDHNRPIAKEQISVLVLGNIGEHKGARVIDGLARYNQRVGSPLRLILAGEIDEGQLLESMHSSLDSWMGRYKDADEVRYLLAESPDVVLLPSIWPETYQYTIDDAREAFPSTGIAVFAAGGAPQDRMLPSDSIMPLAWGDSPPRLLGALLDLAKQ